MESRVVLSNAVDLPRDPNAIPKRWFLAFLVFAWPRGNDDSALRRIGRLSRFHDLTARQSGRSHTDCAHSTQALTKISRSIVKHEYLLMCLLATYISFTGEFQHCAKRRSARNARSCEVELRTRRS